MAAAGGEQRRLVDEVREIGADHARRRRGDPPEVDVGAERHAARVHLEDRLAAVPVGRLHGDAAVEAARAAAAPGRARRAGSSPRSRSRRSTESKPSISVRIWFSVCSRSSLPPLKPATPEVRERPIASSSSMKTIAGAASFACCEQVADARGADADDRLDELGRGHREERRVRLAGDRAGEQRLAGAGRPGEQHAVRDPRAERHVLLGVAEEVDDLGQLLLGLVDPGDVGERHPHPRRLVRCARASGRTSRAPPARSPARRISRTSSPMKRIVGPKPTSRFSHHGDAAGERLRVDDDALLLEQLRERLRVGERRDLGAELRRGLRARVARRLS